MSRAAGIRAALVSVVVFAVWASGHAEVAKEDHAKLAPRAEGLLLARCAVCHSTDLISQQRLDRTHWEATIQKMMHWGADVSQEEAAFLVSYLSGRYHEGAPDQEPVAAPEHAAEPLRADTYAAAGYPAGEAGRGEVVYAHNCQACHNVGAAGGVGPKLAGNPILSDEGRFRETVLHGRGAMPAWESALGVQDIADVRAWLRTLR
jgi:cytochrome c oxidase cbb3-type subunit 3